MNKVLPYLVSGGILVVAAYGATCVLGPELAPPPDQVVLVVWRLLSTGELLQQLGITVVRALCGVAAASLLALFLGILAGSSSRFMQLVVPLVAALQSCPPIIWISLVMVWAGTGSIVPVAVVFASTFPFLFSAIAQGVMGLDRRLLAMSTLYAVPWGQRCKHLVLPSVRPYLLAGISSALATGWKAAAVAEFMGSHYGVGARIFWAYRRMDMGELNAWAFALICLGVFLECALITPLRRNAANMQSKGDDRHVAA